MSELILTQRDEHIVTVVLNRPEKMNALTKGMWQRLGEVMDELSADESIRCIVIRGAGDKSFAPGNDISEFEKERSNIEQARAYGAIMHQTFATFERCPHPIVAMIHGICVGGGLEIAAMCDMRICGESSRLGAPIKQLALVMSPMEMRGLFQLVGPATTLEILLEGRLLDAQEALQKGLVNRVVKDNKVEKETYATAQRIAEGAPLVARWHKKFVKRFYDPTPLTDTELDEGYQCYGTEDFQIGYQSFLAKKKPVFKGK